MYIKNKTNKNFTFPEVLAGNDLQIPAGGASINFAPNKKILDKFVKNQHELELHAISGHELAAAAEIDSRVETLLILD